MPRYRAGYFLAFCAAQRFRCAFAILFRASALSVRFFQLALLSWSALTRIELLERARLEVIDHLAGCTVEFNSILIIGAAFCFS